MPTVSTQNPTETQECVAHALGVPMNKVVCRVKRMGGGFGGKESRNVGISMVMFVTSQCSQIVYTEEIYATIKLCLDEII